MLQAAELQGPLNHVLFPSGLFKERELGRVGAPVYLVAWAVFVCLFRKVNYGEVRNLDLLYPKLLYFLDF